jgi:hypothetical protein
LEKKIQTQDWAKIFNLSLFGMCVVEARLAFKQTAKTAEDQREFYIKLSKELINKTYNRRKAEEGRGRHMVHQRLL